MRTAFVIMVLIAWLGRAQATEQVVDIPTRPGVTQRFLLSASPDAKAAAVLFAGRDGILHINEAGALSSGRSNFLVRSAGLFTEHGLTVALIDAPSDRQAYPHLSGFRETAEHAADVKAVIAWLRQNVKRPVWLIGTSRGTQSVAAVATQLAGADAPDGVVLTSTILNDGRARPVPSMAVHALKIPVLVVHHEQDACRFTMFRDVPKLMEKLAPVRDKALMTFRGGENQGSPCEAMAYHGFNGIEKEVVQRIAAWITSR